MDINSNYGTLDNTKPIKENVNKILSDTMKIKRKIDQLHKNYHDKIEHLGQISNEINSTIVKETKFDKNIINLMRSSRKLNFKFRISGTKAKKTFSEVLKIMGENIMKELFFVDRIDLINKSKFRSIVENRVKSFLGNDFIDFESITRVPQFEKMKKSIINSLVFHENRKKIAPNYDHINSKVLSSLSKSNDILNDFIMGLSIDKETASSIVNEYDVNTKFENSVDNRKIKDPTLSVTLSNIANKEKFEDSINNIEIENEVSQSEPKEKCNLFVQDQAVDNDINMNFDLKENIFINSHNPIEREFIDFIFNETVEDKREITKQKIIDLIQNYYLHDLSVDQESVNILVYHVEEVLESQRKNISLNKRNIFQIIEDKLSVLALNGKDENSTVSMSNLKFLSSEKGKIPTIYCYEK